jgi:methionine--tRNA ligase beta chain
MKDIISFDDFSKLDLRVGKVLKAENVEGSVNLIRLQVDFGKEIGERKILAGMAKFYLPLKLKGKKFVFVVNLAPKQMMKEQSHGMMMALDLGEDVKILPVDKKIPEGTIIR